MDAREKVLRAALKVFEEAGTRGATTRRIAAEAGVNEITLFRHFGTKGALLSEAVRWAAQQYLEQREGLPREPGDPRAELVAWARAQTEHLTRMRSMIRTCMGEVEQAPELAGCAGQTPARLTDELAGYVEALQRHGLADPAVSSRGAAAMLMGALFADAMGRDVVPDRYAFPASEAPELYVDLFLRALAVRSTDAPKRGA